MGWIAVSGATSGIGAAVAEALFRSGHRVAMVVRRPEVATELASRWGGGGHAAVVTGDLARLAGVRAAAEGLLGLAGGLDAVIHNAGIWPRRRQITPDGLETAFVVNHLAPFLLDTRLAPALAAGGGGRVVLVSAGLYPAGRIDPERTPTGEDFGPLRTYAATKRCAVMVGRRRALRWQEAGVPVTWNAIHPGVVRTALGEAGGGLLDALLGVVKRLWASPAQAAQGPVRLATDPGLAGVTGRWFDQGDERPWHPAALDEDLTTALWEQAERLVAP